MCKDVCILQEIDIKPLLNFLVSEFAFKLVYAYACRYVYYSFEKKNLSKTEHRYKFHIKLSLTPKWKAQSGQDYDGLLCYSIIAWLRKMLKFYWS